MYGDYSTFEPNGPPVSHYVAGGNVVKQLLVTVLCVALLGHGVAHADEPPSSRVAGEIGVRAADPIDVSHRRTEPAPLEVRRTQAVGYPQGAATHLPSTRVAVIWVVVIAIVTTVAVLTLPRT
jgi:hypothetical protein